MAFRFGRQGGGCFPCVGSTRYRNAPPKSAASAAYVRVPIVSATAAKRTGFLDLPAELRNRVYELALVQDDAILVSSRIPGSANARVTNILATCRRINDEATAMYYGANKFEAESCLTAAGFLGKLRPETIACLRSLSLCSKLKATSYTDQYRHDWLVCFRDMVNVLAKLGKRRLRSDALILPISSSVSSQSPPFSSITLLRDIDEYLVVGKEGRWQVEWDPRPWNRQASFR